MSGVYADKGQEYPVGSTVASKQQFQQLETLFNAFYKWHVPGKVVNKKISPCRDKTGLLDDLATQLCRRHTDGHMINNTGVDEREILSLFVN